MRSQPFTLALLIGFATACHPGPITNANQSQVGGTIAGRVSTADATVGVPGRKVTAIEVAKGTRFDATTAVNGGYTIKVPEGTYRLEIELQGAEALAKRPDDTQVNNGDLDPARDFVITIKSARR